MPRSLGYTCPSSTCTALSTDGSVSGQLILIILIVFNLYTVAIAVPITVGLLTALITAVITSIIVCLVMRRNTKKTTGGEGGAGGPVYDVPTINKEQQIIDTQLNTAYGQINTSL